MSLADIFVAHDGDASIPGEIIIVAGIVAILIGAAIWCRWRRSHRRKALLRLVNTNSDSITRLAKDERQLEEIVRDIRARIIADWAPEAKPERHLKVL